MEGGEARRRTFMLSSWPLLWATGAQNLPGASENERSLSGPPGGQKRRGNVCLSAQRLLS